MWKVKLCVIIALTFMPMFTVSLVLRDSYVKAYENTKRISPPKVEEGFFLSGLYNRKGKPHDRGADWGLTSDVYTKPNPFYTKHLKKESEEKKPEPVYYPVNHSVTQDVGTAPSEEHYDVIPSTSYDPKTHTYSAPANSYGSPSYSVHSVPSHSYSSSYGAPGSGSYYPQSSYSQPQQTYGAPSYYPPSTAMSSVEPQQKGSHTEWFVAKILKKFDLVLMSKIILKLIIFKKIIKFIGVICLLMFIPLLKKKFEDHSGELDDEERRISSLDAYANVDFRLKEIVNFAFTAIEGFSTNNIPWCVGKSEFYCRLQYMLDQIDFRYPGGRIMGLWFPELQTTTTAAPSTTADPKHSSLESVEKFDEGNVDFNDFITESPDMVSNEAAETEDSNENRLEQFHSIFGRRST